MNHSRTLFALFAFMLCTALPGWAAPDLTFGSGSTKVEVYFPCNPQNSCNNDCHSVYLKAASAGNWTFNCAGAPPVSYFNTPYVCFNCTSFNVTFTFNGQSVSQFISVPNANPVVTASIGTASNCLMSAEAEDRGGVEALLCKLCVVSNSSSSASCPIESYLWKVTYNCPASPTFYFSGPGPHNVPIYPIIIHVCLTVTAGCTVKTVCRDFSCIFNCPGMAPDSVPVDLRLLEGLVLLEEPDAEAITLSPNPAHESLSLANLPDIPEVKYSLEMYDILGKQAAAYVLERQGTEANVQLNGIRQGLYIALVKDQNGKVLHTQKLVIE